VHLGAAAVVRLERSLAHQTGLSIDVSVLFVRQACWDTFAHGARRRKMCRARGVRSTH
jgi:hypothetical protein